jgi:hypothetical protein
LIVLRLFMKAVKYIKTHTELSKPYLKQDFEHTVNKKNNDIILCYIIYFQK